MAELVTTRLAAPTVQPGVLLEALRFERGKRAAERSLHAFVQQAWPVVEPGVPFTDGWHLQVICEHLEAVSKGQIRRLLINIPPRHAKSTIVAVMWPCWEWIHRPHEKYLCASYSGVLSTRDNLKARRLITSPWFQERWGDRFQLSGDQNQKTRFENDQTGYRIASSVGGTATGEGGSRLILDDPHGAQDAQSEAIRETALEWFDMVWSTRLNNPKTDAMVTIMQRLHEKDVSGRILELGGWEHLCLPAEFDGMLRTTRLGAYDRRKKDGELLWPARFGEAELVGLKAQLGEYGVAGQLQQRPTPAGGGIIKTAWFDLWPHDKPIPQLEYVVQSYDTAFTQHTHGDPTACTVWGVFKDQGVYNVLLLDCWAEHLEYPDLRNRVIKDWAAKYAGDAKDPLNNARAADVILVEKKGSGQSLLQDLRRGKIQVAEYNPGNADKVARAHVVAPIIEAGLVWLPESKQGDKWVTWADDFMRQVSRFPNDAHDDMVDTMTQALRYLKDLGFLGLRESSRLDEDRVTIRKNSGNPYAA